MTAMADKEVPSAFIRVFVERFRDEKKKKYRAYPFLFVQFKVKSSLPARPYEDRGFYEDDRLGGK